MRVTLPFMSMRATRVSLECQVTVAGCEVTAVSGIVCPA